ncbi:uncharacterized protein [Anabrus simplex]|uniref:uncharacterized protein n=1 Tax=Anabrus simplex TaxID=316456 RepID=UPI0035A262A1
MDVLLMLFLAFLAQSVEGRQIRGEQILNPVFLEPSSRDLDVGIAIGVPEDDRPADDVLNSATGIRHVGSGGRFYSPPPVQNSGPVHFIVNQQGIPVPQNLLQHQQDVLPTLLQNVQNGPKYGKQYQQNTPMQSMDPFLMYPRPFLQQQQNIPERTSIQNVEPIPLYPTQQQDMEPIPMYPVADTTRQPRLVYNQQGVPVMISRPYGDRRVGAFKLRNDRGYQVMMEVPPTTPGTTGGGVLVMEMQATLYRPVQ